MRDFKRDFCVITVCVLRNKSRAKIRHEFCLRKENDTIAPQSKVNERLLSVLFSQILEKWKTTSSKLLKLKLLL